jgi:hypothetical protein
MKAESSNWTSNEEIFNFFQEESALPQDQRLSASCGKGLW